jgi:hypothetical protein
MPSEHPDNRTTMLDPIRASGRDLAMKLFPELATSLVLLGIWLGLLPQWLTIPVEDTVVWLVGIEAATLLFMVTLVDIATRLKEPPPWWLGAALIVGMLILFPEISAILVAGWQMGLWVFLPLAWSLLERFRELWTMPGASQIEKYRRRALSWGRLGTGMILFGLLVAVMLGYSIVLDDQSGTEAVIETLVLPLLCLFYLIAAIDAWRVHRPGFVRRPRSLWPFLDSGDTTKMELL